jgi:hypothetical protein
LPCQGVVGAFDDPTPLMPEAGGAPMLPHFDDRQRRILERVAGLAEAPFRFVGLGVDRDPQDR